MIKFDPDNLSLANVIVVLIPFAILVSIWFWLSQKPYDFDGARGLAVDSNGVIHIQVGNDLYRMDESGNSLPKIDMTELGVVDFLGDLTFNDSNELLLRPGSYTTGFLENLSILNRESNKQSLEADSGDGLSLCDLSTMQCRAFGSSAHDFNRGFFSAYNNIDGTTVISDASRHQVFKFDSDGNTAATSKEDYIFPNEVVFDDNALFLVDTNNKVIKQLDHSDAEFGNLLNSHIAANPDSNEKRFHWPFNLTKAGENWWLIMLDSGMNKGGVYLYDADWNYIEPLGLEENALPVAMLSLGDEVLLSDIESSGVNRYSLSGDYLGVLEHAELNSALANNTKQREFYRSLGFWYLVLIALSTVLLLVWVYFHQSKVGMAQLVEKKQMSPARELNVTPIEDLVEWMPGTGLLGTLEKARRVQMIGFASCCVVLGLVVFYTISYVEVNGGLSAVSTQLLFLAFACCSLLLLTEACRVRIGVHQEQLVLHDQVNDRAFLASGETVLHDGQRIAFGELVANTRQATNRGDELAVFVRHVYPLLSNATIIKPPAMNLWMRLNARKQNKELLVKIGLFMLVVIVLVGVD